MLPNLIGNAAEIFHGTRKFHWMLYRLVRAERELLSWVQLEIEDTTKAVERPTVSGLGEIEIGQLEPFFKSVHNMYLSVCTIYYIPMVSNQYIWISRFGGLDVIPFNQ